MNINCGREGKCLKRQMGATGKRVLAGRETGARPSLVLLSRFDRTLSVWLTPTPVFSSCPSLSFSTPPPNCNHTVPSRRQIQKNVLLLKEEATCPSPLQCCPSHRRKYSRRCPRSGLSTSAATATPEATSKRGQLRKVRLPCLTFCWHTIR